MTRYFRDILFYVETTIMVQYIIEYVLRVWSAGCRGRYRGFKGRLRFCRRFFCILDFVVVVCGIVVFIGGYTQSRSVSATSALRSLRFLQIIRMVRLDRGGSSWKLLGSVFSAHMKELLSGRILDV